MGARQLSLTLAAALLATAPALACTLTSAAGTVVKSGYTVRYSLSPERFGLNAPFQIEIAASGPDGPVPDGLTVDADMPAHRHGMNYQPRVTALGGGRFLADGLALHMQGAWRLKFAILTDAGAVRLNAPHCQQ